MRFSDDILMAYADGELDAAVRAEIEAAMATDPEVHRAVLRHRALAEKVRAAYAGVLAEPVPAQLASVAAAPVTAPVVELAARRAARAAAPLRRGIPQWAAMAASVALGLMVGVFLLRGPAAPWEQTATGLVARGELDAVLTRQLAGSVGTGGPQAGNAAQVGFSFRERGGPYCRTFLLPQEAPLAGLACRESGEWRLRVLAEAPAAAGELRPAGAMPLAVLEAVDAAIEGEPLDAAAEAAARDAGWQEPSP